MLAKVAAVSQFPGFVRWAHADQSNDLAQHAASANGTYRPQFFKADEYATVDRLTALIIPADETPGAHEAGVAEFIDFMAASDTDLQGRFRTGLAWLDARAISALGAPFLQLQEAKQVQILEGAVSTEFFRLIREYTVMGYYTSRIGLAQLDYPGLKMYAQSPACPHQGNPGHRHLSGEGG